MKVKSVNSVGKRKVYDISVQDVEHYVLENGVVTHNTGIMYSANWAFIMGKAQDKDGTDLVGYKFTINIEKSRYVREKSKLPLMVRFDGGINKYSGLLDLALELGWVYKPSMGWFSTQLIDPETGEVDQLDGKKWRAKDTETPEFWDVLLQNENFKKAIEKRFKL